MTSPHKGCPHSLAATKQLYEWFSLPVCLSVRLFARLFARLSHLFHYVPIIDVHAKGQGQRSKAKGKNQLSRFRTVIPVWIHIWQWNDAQSFMWLRRGALSFFEVICQISRSHRTKKSPILTQIERFRTVTPVLQLFFKVIHQIWRSHRTKNCQFWPKLNVSGL